MMEGFHLIPPSKEIKERLDGGFMVDRITTMLHQQQVADIISYYL